LNQKKTGYEQQKRRRGNRDELNFFKKRACGIRVKQFVQAFKKRLEKSLSGFEKFNKRHLTPNETNGEARDKKLPK
jgi:hypothetical protein